MSVRLIIFENLENFKTFHFLLKNFHKPIGSQNSQYFRHFSKFSKTVKFF
jgi:hypothetical protein